MKDTRAVGTILISLALCGDCVPSLRADGEADLDLAFDRLQQGRNYKVGFPETKWREQVVDQFLGDVDVFFGPPQPGKSPPETQPKPPLLDEALSLLLDIRNGENVTADQRQAAEVLANEALEAISYGYLMAGNNDLLDGLRMAYPNSGGGGRDERELPREAPTVLDTEKLKQLYFATRYFLEGIKTTLGFMQSDPSGRIRAADRSEESGGSSLPQYTVFNDDDNPVLPHPRFEDSASIGANQKDEFSLTAGALMGRLLGRYGVTALGMSDKLWREAFFDVSRSTEDREEMLQVAQEVLRCNIHSQFLAVLPLAATLEDGSGDAGVNDFQGVDIDGVRSSVTSAEILMGRIARGERPKHHSLIPGWSKQQVDNQMTTVAQKHSAAATAWNLAETAINRREQAASITAADVQTRRSAFETRLWQITGIDPSDFNALAKEEDRRAYLLAVEELAENAMLEGDVNNSWFNSRPFNAPSDFGVAEMGLAALRALQAINQLNSSQARIQGIPQRIAIENNRNQTVNSIITRQGFQLAALDVALSIANRFKVTACACGLSSGVMTEFNLGAVVAAAQAFVRNDINTSAQTGINNANSRATIENLLVEQEQLVRELPSAVIQAQLAIAELKRLNAEVVRLIEDHLFHQQSTEDLWHRDPSVVFEQEKAELDYEKRVADYQIELYRLAKMLESAWAEGFENPAKRADGTPASPLSSGTDTFDLFTDAESVFATLDYTEARDFYNALKAWNDHLLSQRPKPAAGIKSDFISVRQHLMGLTDFSYNEETQRFELDTALRTENVRNFRAILIRAQERARESGNSLRLEFGFDHRTQSEIDTTTSTVKTFVLTPDSNVWNRRMTGIGIRLRGRDVATGRRVPSGRVLPVQLYMHGSITREEFFRDSKFENTRATREVDLTLSQSDPDELLAGGFDGKFFFSLNAAVDLTPLDPTNLDVFVPVDGFPVSCDRYILIVEEQAGILNVENIDDIELLIQWDFGPPVGTGPGLNYAWQTLN